MPNRLRPLDDRVIVKPNEAEEITPGGIVLPDNAKEKPFRGIVMAIGPGRLLDNGSRSDMSVKPGDEVIYTRYGAADVELDGQSVKILSESDILAVVGEKS